VPAPGRGDVRNEQSSYCKNGKVECDHRNGLHRCVPIRNS
jgi:hypothetical protein